MRRSTLFAGALLSLAVLGGCQTWQQGARADAFTACGDIADPAKRETCQSGVMAAAGQAHRAEMEERRQEILESEDRKALREAYGLPDKTH
jgi:hypothetical protein